MYTRKAAKLSAELRKSAEQRDFSAYSDAAEALRSIASFPQENPNPVLRAGLNGTLLYANASSAGLLAQWQCQPGSIVPRHVLEKLTEATRTNAAIEYEEVCGRRVYSLLITPSAERQYLNIYGRDITEAKQNDLQLQKLNRLLRALGKSNQAMVRASSETSLLEEICRTIVEDCGHPLVWIGFAENDVEKTIRPVAWAGFEEGYLRNLKLTWADTERGHGPSGTAIRTGRPAGCADVRADPNFAPWREEAIKRGYAASLCVPLLDAERAFGAIAIYSREPNSFSENDVQMLTSLASDLAYGLSVMRIRAERERFEHELEKLVAERTRSLEETTKQLNEFCYSIAHDLKAPLRAQAGFADALIQDFGQALGPQGRNYAERIRAAAQRQSKLVSDLLAHIALGRLDLPLDAVDLRDAVHAARAELHSEIHQKHAQVQCELFSERVLANPESLQLVLVNLLSNALKFVPPGTRPRVKVSAEPQQQFLRLWVEDNGIGIAPQHHDRLFGVFQRLHTADVYPGTGIGLALVKRSVERMGGRVGVESRPGKGSRFWFELPRSK